MGHGDSASVPAIGREASEYANNVIFFFFFFLHPVDMFFIYFQSEQENMQCCTTLWLDQRATVKLQQNQQ